MTSVGCSSSTSGSDSGTPSDSDPAADPGGDGSMPVEMCGPTDDADHDGIPLRFEGPGDADRDGVLNADDPDSDNDGIPDAFEAEYGGQHSCSTPPVDSDNDGTFDFLDSDANGDGIPDARQAPPNTAQPGSSAMPAADRLQGGGRGILQPR